MPRREDQQTAPLSPYAVSKLASEQFCLVAHKIYGVEAVALRYFNVFGEYQDPYSGYAAVIPKFIRLMLAGERPTIFGDGLASRDFTHIENVVSANMLAADAPLAESVAMNVATGTPFTLNELVASLNELLGTDIAPIYGDPRPGDVVASHADIGRARELIGYEPRIDFETGLQRTIDFLSESLAAAQVRS
jgi:UDP-glucose 4-epimerase